MAHRADGLNDIFEHDVTIRDNLKTKSGQIETTPADNEDIVNKKYVDDEIDAKIEDGTAAGQMTFWDGSTWKHTETTEAVWDDVNKRAGYGIAIPTSPFHINATAPDIASGTIFRVSGEFASTTNDQAGIQVNPVITGSGTPTVTDTGIISTPILNATGYGGSTLTGMQGGGIVIGTGDLGALNGFTLASAHAGTGEINTYVGAAISDIIKFSTGDTLNCVGLNVASIVTGTSSNFAIKTVLGLVSFGDDVGIGTTTPTQPLSVKEKGSMTAIGGFAIKLTNKTGANTIQGQLVKADTATNDAVILAGIGDVECFGVFLEAGVADGAEAWVVVSGIADVAFDDNVAAVRGNWVATGVAAGYARTSASPAAAPNHFEEIGHCIENVTAGGAGTHILARCVLHFN